MSTVEEARENLEKWLIALLNSDAAELERVGKVKVRRISTTPQEFNALVTDLIVAARAKYRREAQR